MVFTKKESRIYKVVLILFNMAKWGLLISVGLIILAMFLANSNFSYFAGDVYWQTDKAGFLSGLIHGILAPIFLVAQIFTDYTMYELNNSGWFYNLGFLIGLLFVWGGGGKGTNSVVKNYYNMPKGQKGKPVSLKLSEEDHNRIEKTVEKKIDQKIKQSENTEKPKDSILVSLFNSKKNKPKKNKKR